MVNICESHAKGNDLQFSSDPDPEKSKTMYTVNPESKIPNHATHVIETNVEFRLIYSVVLPEHIAVRACSEYTNKLISQSLVESPKNIGKMTSSRRGSTRPR